MPDLSLARRDADALTMARATLAEARAVLGAKLVGCYLRGSLALGAFDPATSDVDFVVVTEQPIAAGEYTALATAHERLAARPMPFAQDLEGTYWDRAAAWRYRPADRHPTVARGEPLTWQTHGTNWILERWTVRERGVTLTGPPPATLIAPISPDDLRAATRARLPDWAAYAATATDPDWSLARGHKAYVVATLCRALFTLRHGALASKPESIAWAARTLPAPWRATVERSRAWRGDATSDPALNSEVRAFVFWATGPEGQRFAAGHA